VGKLSAQVLRIKAVDDAALAYYHDHREEIRRQISESENLIQEMQAETPSILQQKLKKLSYPGKSNLSFSDYHKTIC
jgi:hypothetical protein